MKTARKVLSFVIALTFILSAFPIPVAFAEGEEYEVITLDTPVVVTATEENLGVEIFKFVAEEGGRYKFFSSDNDFDTYGEVYDKDMNLIAENDDGAGNFNFEIAFAAVAGETYYLKARGYNEQTSSGYSVVLQKMPGVESVSLDKENVTGKLFDTQTLNLTVYPEDVDILSVEWVSNDESVVKIDSTYNSDMSAKIKFVGEGTTTVVATVDGYITATCTFTVEEPSYEQFMPEQTKVITATEDNSGEAVYKFVPEESGTYKFYSHDNDLDTYGHIYDSGMDEIYSDDDGGDGNNFYIEFEAVAGEEYYLRARPYSTETSGQYSVSVNKVVTASAISLSADTFSAKIGATCEIELTFLPENASQEEITWSTNDDTIVKFTANDNIGCRFMLIDTGTATVTATSENGLTASCTVTACAPVEITEGELIEVECSDDVFRETYLFVPEETGIYKFDENMNNASYGLRLYDSDFNYISSSSWMQVELTAGKKYYYTVDAEKSEDAEYIDFSLVVNHLVPATGIVLSDTEIYGKVATYETITVEFLPENAIEEEITWTSSNEDAVVIYDTWNSNKTCEVKIVGKGSSVLTATTESGFTASCTVTADQIVDVNVDETHTRYEEEGYSYTYMFEPEETGTYMFDFTCVNAGIDWVVMYDGELSWLDSPSGDFQYEFIAGETYYLNPEAYVDYNQDEGDESYISLTVSKLVPAEALILSEETVTEKVGKKLVLNAYFAPDNAIDEDITWTSSDDSVAVIYDIRNNSKSCEIQFVGIGTATITATSENGYTDTCTITVEDVLEITLGDTALIKDENGSFSRSANYYKFIPEEDGIYKFTVSGDNIFEKYVSVWDNNRDVNVSDFTSVQETLVAGKTYYCQASAPIIDYDYESSATLTIEKLVSPTSLEINTESYIGTVAQYVVIKASLGPEGCASEYINWSSSDESIAQIDDWWNDGYCRFFLSDTGTVTITAKSESGLTDTCTITVNEPSEISLNEEKNLSTDKDGMATGSYKFVPEEDGVYAFYSFDNEYDTYGYVYDSEGNELSYNDDGGDGNNFFATFEATAGEIYYLSARPFSIDAEGEYFVSVKKVIKATSISFKEQSVTSRIGNTKDLYVVFGPEGAVSESVSFTSSNESVVEVLNGLENDAGKGCTISFVGAGTATITATSENGLTATCTVTVEDIPEITLGDTPLVKGDNGYYSSVDNYFKFIPEEDGTYKFTVSGENTYDETVYLWNDDFDTEGYYDVSYRLTAGETYYVKAYAEVDNIGAESSAVITVEKVQSPTSMTLSPEKTTSVIADEITVDVVFGPEGSATEDFDWEISDENVLEAVSGDDTFVNFFAIGAGEATVTITSESGLTASCTITIAEPTEISLDEGKEISTDNNSGVQVFKFIPEEDGIYGFYSFDNDFDTYGYVYDSDVCEINRNDDGEENNNFLVQFEAVAGEVYYLRARPYDYEEEGTYYVSVKKFVEPTILRLSQMSYSGEVLDLLSLKASIGPVGAYDEEIIWTSSDESVAYIVDYYGKSADIRLSGEGNAIITATTESGLKATCTITSAEPEEITLENGSTVVCSDRYYKKTIKFIPEEDGIYRFDLSVENATGEYVLYNSDDLSSYDYNETGEFELTAGETYYCQMYFWSDDITDSVSVDLTVLKCGKATAMALSKSSVSARITEEFTLDVLFGPDGAASEEIEWDISDTSVVKIQYSENDEAQFQIVGTGNATITATSESGLTASCTVTGIDAISVESDSEVGLSLDSSEGSEVYKFTPDQTAIYRIYSTESNLSYSYIRVYNSEFEWINSDNFNEDAFNLGFHGISGETYYISFMVESEEESCSCKFKVSAQTAATSLSLMADTLSGKKYERYYCEYEFAPLNAAREEIIWTSSNSDVVRVDNGYLYLDDIGVATITATTPSGLTDSITVTVTEPEALTLDVQSTVEYLDYREKASMSFTPEVSGYYTFTSISGEDTCGSLYDENHEFITSDDDAGEGNNFLVTAYLEAGQVYYLTTYKYSLSKTPYNVVASKVLMGDITQDGQVDIYDYQQLVNFTVLTNDDIKQEYGTNTFTVADMNNDGAVDALDAWKLALIINN